ncbi:DUF962 domain-containing protein [Aggregicoccus sp. 17bor-14]|uniref:Mpo1 family 2-hydroxy fatty acid dioxygenase n=1 Tax=Myxococcaceae TaxID=31 RepID=UPI00129CAF6C|nr:MULTISPECIES: Mpo1-like protein [Myxococcaceae]MBF5042373.1 DUF962 domain-containing protein [Simulacricoccus sp. 17bor-14]MRI88146.1 DUF962 domain-containing protein [Aggregicoccus sp. 17bor-14]
MKTLVEHLAGYAAYHRDRRNIATHFIGIPMIVLGVQVLMSRTALTVAGLALTPALAASAAALLFYLRLDRRYGAVMALLLGLGLWAASGVAAQAHATWLGTGLGLFVVGWAAQFVGHVFEGRKPAFVDDLVGLLVGPLFVAAEAGFLLGLRTEVQREIEARLSPLPAAGR